MMSIFVRVSRMVIFVLSVEAGTAPSSCLRRDTFTSWFWQSCKHLPLPQVRADTTKSKFAALVVDKWLYIDGGEIWAASSVVWSTPSPWQLPWLDINTK